MKRTFSGVHPFRPVCLRDLIVRSHAEQDAPPPADAAIWQTVKLVRMIDRGDCPRCARALGDETHPAGSRVTPCRCIPVCSGCGSHEAFTRGHLNDPAIWPMTAEMMREAGKRPARSSLPPGQVPVQGTGGWLAHGFDDPSVDEHERRGR